MPSSSTQFKKGHKGYWSGKEMSEVTKSKMRGRTAEKNPTWKGENAGYFAKHIALKQKFGKASQCENRTNKILDFVCENKSNIYQWAKKRGNKYTRDKEDYYQLCSKCHKKYDLTPEIIKRLKEQGIQKGSNTGIKTRFKKGQTPWNKKS